jgi:hypothetical protein
MKPLQALHGIVTAVLGMAVASFALLVLTGAVEVHFPARGQVGDRPAAGSVPQTRANPAGAKARLLVVRGTKPGMEYPLFEGPNVVGRADEKPVEIDLEFQEFPGRIWSSRQHAVIVCTHLALTIEDLNSSNGTYVNRSRVPPGTKQELKANDVIQIGEVQLQVVW